MESYRDFHDAISREKSTIDARVKTIKIVLFQISICRTDSSFFGFGYSHEFSVAVCSLRAVSLPIRSHVANEFFA